MFQTIIFDVDGTLLNTEPVYMRAWQEAGAIFGYHVPTEALLRTRAVNRQVAEAVFRRYCGERFDYATVRKERVRIGEELIRTTAPRQLRMPGALEVLTALKEMGYILAAATSTPRQESLEHLQRAELGDFFTAVVCGDMICRGKPEPDIFLEAARLAGAEPEQCLAVGDTPADVLAATAAGMKVVLIPDQVPPTEEIKARSWHCLENLEQLLAVLRAMG